MSGMSPVIPFRVILAFFLFVAVMGLTTRSPAETRTIRYGFTLQNVTGRAVKKAVFSTLAPVAETSHQKSLSLTASHDFELISDALGNRIMRFTFVNLPPYAVKIIRITARIEMRSVGLKLADNGRNFLAPARFVESDAPEIARQAVLLKGEDGLATAGRISRWVADVLHYSGFSGREKGALAAITQREGDCTEFADLFVALARADGLPARRVAGYVVGGNAILKPVGFHNWAEFRLQGIWEIADPQRKVFIDQPRHYLAFRIGDGQTDNETPLFNRFRVEGEGLQARMNSR